VRVRIRKAGADEPKETWPQFEPPAPAPGSDPRRREWQAYRAAGGPSR
jgi:hypothetical protein